MDVILSSLTDSQRQAVQHVDGPLLILAGPGSGKTRVVTHRVAYLREQGIIDEQILAVTFTNKAADEMRQRLERLAPGARVWMGTFHRFCSRLLRQYASLVGLRENFSIYDTDDSRKLLHEAIDDAGVELVHTTPARVASAISWAKNDLIGPDEYVPTVGSPLGHVVSNVYPHYQRRLMAANAVDFDDLLMHVATLLRDNEELRRTLDNRFRYILVDEYQDTNLAQYAIIRALSVKCPNLAVTGDPDQSIYGWRGATIRNILEFERDFPDVKVVRLEQNYRSTKCILRAANQLIIHNEQRKEKTLFTHNDEGRPVRVVIYPTGQTEAQAIAVRMAHEVAAGQRRANDYAIFYRTNALSRLLERALRAVSLPYQIVRGLEFYQRKEVKDILAYLHLLANPASDIACLRIINTPPRQIGTQTVKRLKRHAAAQRISLLSAAREAGLIESLSKRSAVHVAKFVAMIDAMQPTGDERVEVLMRRVLEGTGYREWLEMSESEEDEQRLENIDELLSDAREFDEAHVEDGGLEAFLEQASLVADVDDWNPDVERVTMMTLHAAKGLEFPVVFIVAVEDDLLPHEHSKENANQVEEERRLLFVGMTRAKEELHLSAAQMRSVRGAQLTKAPSPFLLELPTQEMEVVGRIVAPTLRAGQAGEFDELPEYDLEPDMDLDDDDDFDFDFDFDDDDDDDDPGPTRRRRAKDNRPGAGQSAHAARRGPAPAAAHRRPLMTAAQLAGHQTPPSSSAPESFEPGMIVSHPLHGLGKIVSLAGSGIKRAATVQFAGEQQKRTFYLAYSDLQPVRSNGGGTCENSAGDA